MGYLDINENRDRQVQYTYTTDIRPWKKNHKKRTTRKIKEKKTRKWQMEVLCNIFPQKRKWFCIQ